MSELVKATDSLLHHDHMIRVACHFHWVKVTGMFPMRLILSKKSLSSKFSPLSSFIRAYSAIAASSKYLPVM